MDYASEAPSRDKPLSVSQLTGQVKSTLESRFPALWIVGEISNLKRANSGHWYFTLKDDKSHLRCNMWRSQAARVPFAAKDGMEILVQGALNVYPPRGEYSLIVNRMEEVGLGRLKVEFERLKAKLQAEGLFDPAHKKPLPLLPRKIGVVTSPTGAAIRDILRVLRMRFPGVHVLLAPARVQGESAATEIAFCIEWLDRHGQCDVIIAGRGGGSEEDLWSFNEEVVARAIYDANTPIVSAVGHEIDYTIADFVADVRAATPSNAAEIVVRSRNEYRQTIHALRRALDRALQRRILQLKNRIALSERSPIFVKVRSRVNDSQRRLAELDARLHRRVALLARDREKRLARAEQGLRPDRLRARLAALANRRDNAARELGHAMVARLDKNVQRLASLANRLADLSPLRVLARGFAAVYSQKGKLVRAPDDVRIGEVIDIRLAEGRLRARVLEEARKIEQATLFE